MAISLSKFARILFPLVLSAGVALPVASQVLNPSGADAQPAPGTTDADPNAGPSFSQITRVYDNWSLQCQERSGEGRCFVETVVRQSKPQVRDVIALRFSLADGGVQATIVTPNRVKLDRGVTLAVGDQTYQTQYAICGPTNCNAVLAPQGGLEAVLRTQSDLSVSFYIYAKPEDGGEREIKIPVSLSGFATAFDHLAVFDAEQ